LPCNEYCLKALYRWIPIAAGAKQKLLRMWKPAETAPFDEDITVLVSDGSKSPYVLLKPCRRTSAGWVVSGKKTPLAVVPLKWMPLQRAPTRARHRLAVNSLERLARRPSRDP
jgi:hypothetical protein